MKWARGEISNFTYLMILNHAAGIIAHIINFLKLARNHCLGYNV